MSTDFDLDDLKVLAALETVKGGAKLDHFGGAKLDQLEMEPRFCFEFLWDGWNVA